jgi:RHS repeat-associated protein
MTVAGQPAVAYSYDNANRLIQIIQGSSVVTFEYDSAGRRTRLTLPNGVSTEYAYDAASRLTGLTYKRGSTVLGTLAYGYDAAGKRTKATGTWARTGLPPAMASATYNAANQQLTVGGSSLSYDLNGSLGTYADTTYTWDARARLVAIAGPGVSASFQYDPFGRRTQKTINGVTTAYVYDGWTPVQERTGVATANLLTGLGIDEYLTRTDSEGRSSLLTDALGSTIALTDDAGVVVAEYTYDPFGATTTTGAASGNPFQYTGRERDGATGLYHYRTRYYSPTLHRFISEDQRETEPWETNLYAYVGNDPISFVDPYGKRPWPGRLDWHWVWGSVAPACISSTKVGPKLWATSS